MDILGLIQLPGWLVTIAAICLSLLLYTLYKQSVFRRIGVPGPWPVPFIGNLLTFMSKDFMEADLYFVRKYGNVFGIYFGNVPEMIVSDLDMIKEICVKQFSNFTDRAREFGSDAFLDKTVFQAEGEDWKFLRSTLSPTFSTGKMRNMTPLIQRCTTSLLDVLKEKSMNKEPIDMLPIYQGFTMDVICTTAFGIDVDAQKNPDDPFVKNAKSLFEFSLNNPWFMLTLLFPETSRLVDWLGVMTDKKAVRFFQDASKDIIAERRKSDSKYVDFVQLMVNAHQDQSKEVVDESEIKATGIEKKKKRALTEEEMVANSLVFLLGGYDTTADTLTMTTHCLTAYPQSQEKVVAEIEKVLGDEEPTYDTVNKLPYLEMVVNETLRLYTPGFRFNRKALADIEISGHFIPKGMDVTIPTYAIHRDERYWPEPEKFDPERFAPENRDKFNPNAYLPFGYGPRICIGMRLALMETKMALVVLLQKYHFKPGPEFKVPPVFKKNAGAKPVEGSVSVILEPRRND